MLVGLLQLAPEARHTPRPAAGDDAVPRFIVLHDVVECHYPPRTHQRRVVLEVAPHAVVGVIPVEEEEINRGGEDLPHGSDRRRRGRVALERNHLLAAPGERAQQPGVGNAEVHADQHAPGIGELGEQIERPTAAAADLEDGAGPAARNQREEADDLLVHLNGREGTVERERHIVPWPEGQALCQAP